VTCFFFCFEIDSCELLRTWVIDSLSKTDGDFVACLLVLNWGDNVSCPSASLEITMFFKRL